MSWIGIVFLYTFGGEILYGGAIIDRGGFFIKPTIVKAQNDWEIVQEETFSSLLLN